jgi:hypothetical protein
MSISSISTSTPVNPVNPPGTSASKTPDTQTANDAGAAPPPVQAPLPPGQGMRIDQLA